MGNTFVCGYDTISFRTYDTSDDRTSRTQSIRKALRMTSGCRRNDSPTWYPPDTSGFWNPASQVIEEARGLFGPQRAINCFISIGFSHLGGQIQLTSDGSWSSDNVKSITAEWNSVSSKASVEAERFGKRWSKEHDTYFRFCLPSLEVRHFTNLQDVEIQLMTASHMATVSTTLGKVVTLLASPSNFGHDLGFAGQSSSSYMRHCFSIETLHTAIPLRKTK
jgi:hypothetical protein